jgi:hypothetical protein
MKNIHVLPTDKPSNLYQIGNDLTLSVVNSTHQNKIGRHICITSDEEIKEGDYIFETDSGYVNIAGKNYYKNSTDFKIILTTDQYLIKDGVQAIDDEFLEWFVKNPSCEFVEVKSKMNHPRNVFGYEIIIPKEEPKQETLEEASSRLLYSKYPFHPPQDSGYWKDMFLEGAKWQQEQDKNRLLEDVKQETCDNCNNDVCCCIIKKQETLEEVSPMNDLLKDLRETKISVKESIDTIEDEFMRTQINIFIQKTLDSVIDRIENELLEIESKWQQEQDKNKYSEEEVKIMYRSLWAGNCFDFDTSYEMETNFEHDFNLWLEQFKNK